MYISVQKFLCDSSLHFCFWKVATLSMDPLGWKGGLKAKWAMSMHDAMEKVKHNLPRIEWPFLVCHGDADQLTMVEGSTMLEQKAASKDKTIKVGKMITNLSYIKWFKVMYSDDTPNNWPTDLKDTFTWNQSNLWLGPLITVLCEQRLHFHCVSCCVKSSLCRQPFHFHPDPEISGGPSLRKIFFIRAKNKWGPPLDLQLY